MHVMCQHQQEVIWLAAGFSLALLKLQYNAYSNFTNGNSEIL